jgi:hypothetical protein
MSKGALSVGHAETYYQEKYSKDDYYTESQRVTGEWYGIGAETLGLSGTVSKEDFRAVLRGTRPVLARSSLAPPPAGTSAAQAGMQPSTRLSQSASRR